ncbi:uncharacterized protein LOC114526194 [Dendronephthya gigantea]|uniref:uncharacterized protein LOC114526194 n=1 Tax=Dendronephthya gigantea TaxID=151771 RepID=UPI00106C960A|nr:uncharacterized protein LOC114526194 [Dendronephthya gigantea]
MLVRARFTMAARFIPRQNMTRLVPRAVFKRGYLLKSARCLHMGEYFTRGRLSEIELQASVPLAGRKYLASSTSLGFPKYLSGPKDDFPMLVKAKKGQETSMKHWALRSREIIDQAYQRYEKSGTAVAILFRGLPNSDEKCLSEWVTNLGFEPFKYVGGVSPRYEVQQNVDDGAHDENVITIEPHNEMSYSTSFPKIFIISCLKKASWGGETAICDNRKLHTSLDPVFVQKCEEKRIRYWNCLHSKDSDKNLYQSWQNRFRTEDKEKVVGFLEEKGYESLWEGNTLFYWHNTPPTVHHVKSGEKLWFNQLSAMHGSYYADMPCHDRLQLANREYPCHSSYGDGVEFTSEEVDNHRRCIWENAAGFDWQNGDILFLDQLIVQHSRLSYEGERRVGVSLLGYS